MNKDINALRRATKLINDTLGLDENGVPHALNEIQKKLQPLIDHMDRES